MNKPNTAAVITALQCIHDDAAHALGTDAEPQDRLSVARQDLEVIRETAYTTLRDAKPLHTHPNVINARALLRGITSGATLTGDAARLALWLGYVLAAIDGEPTPYAPETAAAPAQSDDAERIENARGYLEAYKTGMLSAEGAASYALSALNGLD